MIGQRKLIDKLNTLTLDTLPHSLILVGDAGCGKHTYLNEVVNKLQLEFEDVSELLDDEKILGIQQRSIPTLYLINSDLIKERDQNVILKLLEEPTDFSYICIICSSINGLLPTITNRCYVWNFESYSEEELKNFTNLIGDDFKNTIKILNTPGKLLAMPTGISKYFADADLIFRFINKAIISNILILPDKLSYKLDDTSKIYFDIFIKILNAQALQCYMRKEINLNAMLLTSRLVNDSTIFNIDKKKLYEKYLVDLKDELKRFKGEN